MRRVHGSPGLCSGSVPSGSSSSTGMSVLNHTRLWLKGRMDPAGRRRRSHSAGRNVESVWASFASVSRLTFSQYEAAGRLSISLRSFSNHSGSLAAAAAAVGVDVLL